MNDNSLKDNQSNETSQIEINNLSKTDQNCSFSDSNLISTSHVTTTTSITNTNTSTTVTNNNHGRQKRRVSFVTLDMNESKMPKSDVGN